jgi:class 3 adenylate cyclase
MEGAASAGQILISPETAKLLPRGCSGAALGPGLQLVRSPVPAEWVAPADTVRPADDAIAGALPEIVRALVLGGHAAPEHRTASVAFVQFEDLDDLITREGTETAAHGLDQLVRLVQDACDHYEVCFLDSDISSDGGKIRLSAGAPRVVGDDEERMLLALREIVDGDFRLPVKAGVHRGPVFTGEVGPSYRRWYVVMGDTVNLAARVMGKAPRGHIYATREILRHAQGRFGQAALEPFAVKGKARPVQAWDVGPPTHATARSAVRPEPPLVGTSWRSSSGRSPRPSAARAR